MNLIEREGQEPLEIHARTLVGADLSDQDLHRALLAARPEARVLFMSGYTDQSMEHRGELVRGAAFLQKPITPELLARKVREVLGPAAVC